MQNRERRDLGLMPLLGSIGRLLWGSCAMARLISSNQKNRVVISSTGFLPKGHIRHIGQSRQGRLLITGLLVNLSLLVPLQTA